MYAELKQKICSQCEELKNEECFYRIKGKRPRAECRECTNTYTKKYRSTANGKAIHESNRKKYLSSPCNVLKDKQNKAEWARFKKYKITKLDFLRMLEEQGNKCKLCPAIHSEIKNGLVVDHCHKTEKVRGLLCGHCNTAIGFFKDSIKALQNAITYLKQA